MGIVVNVLVLLAAVVLAPFMLPDPPLVTEVSQLSPELRAWHERGKTISINGHNIFYIYQKCSNKKLKDPPTFVLLHGYPSSSHEYHKTIDPLLAFGHVFIHDHVGFGFSDKPATNYTYSMSEGAENSLAIWRKVGVKNAHVISHDMGDTIFTEILTRRHRGLLPGYFQNFFNSATFTNGGMKYSLINFRISQTLATNAYLGPYFTKLSTRFRIVRFAFTRQVRSIWGPNADVTERDRDIDALCELHRFKGGTSLTYKNMYYLWDRAHFEFRWFAALSEIDIRTRFIWGDSDAVSPVAIPQFFKSFVPGAELSYVKDAGHFFMLEKPAEWVNEVTKVITKP